MVYDTHAHLDYPDFLDEVVGVVERAKAAGVTKIISIGTDLESSRRAVALSEQDPCLYAAVGWHPSDVARAPEDVRPELRQLAQHPKVVAIGEIGLDYYRLPTKKGTGTPADDQTCIEKQKAIFRQQLELAAELGLNCVVHQRDSFEDTLQLVSDYAGKVRTVFHCFSSPVPDLERVLALNSIVSFTGILTFKNAQIVRDTLMATPLDKFMLETDSPFLAPVPYRGKRCEPAYVRETAAFAAQLKGISLEELGRATSTTAEVFFPKIKSGEETAPNRFSPETPR
jgi:TatD DNase family protein